VVEAQWQVATTVEHPLQREHLRMGRRELQQEGGVREREVLRGEPVVLHVAWGGKWEPVAPVQTAVVGRVVLDGKPLVPPPARRSASVAAVSSGESPSASQSTQDQSVSAII